MQSCDMKDCKAVAEWSTLWDNPGNLNDNHTFYWCDNHLHSGHILVNTKHLEVL